MFKVLARIATCFISLLIITTIISFQMLHAASILNEIQTIDSYPYRILSGTQPDEYWIINQSKGLMLLEEALQGNWVVTDYFISHIRDAVGPDSNGYIYCSSYLSDVGAILQVFDCNTRTVVQDIQLGPDYVLTGIELSADENRLYVMTGDWPRVGESYNWGDSAAHADSGIIWEIDTSTLTVTDQSITCALPETIFYAEGSEIDKLLVSSEEASYVRDSGPPYNSTVRSMIDVILVQRGLPRDAQIMCTHSLSPFTNDFLTWDAEEHLVGICCLNLESEEDDSPYRHGIWILDTDTNQVVDSLLILDADGNARGVRHALISEVYPGHVYVALGSGSFDRSVGILVIDYETGALIDSIQTGDNSLPQFMYELDDGRLIVTGGRSGLIQIIDPTE